MATQRIIDFLATRRPDGPCLVVDLDVVADNFRAFERALPDSRIYYAIKANPAPEILRMLAKMGSSFDAASVAEVEMAMNAGASASRISFGNTIKKERDIARAYQLGVRLFAVDCVEEVEKIARVAAGSRVFCRVLTDGAGAEWPLSRKFGCAPVMAVDVLRRAHALGLEAYGVSFHVGSQQTDLAAWDRALGDARQVFATLAEEGIVLRMVTSAAASRRATCATCRRRKPMARPSSTRCASISAMPFPRRSSSRAVAWSAMPASSSPRSC